MATLPTSLGAITLFVDDVTRAKGFYQDVFDLSPIYEDENAAAFKFGTRSSTCSPARPRTS